MENYEVINYKNGDSDIEIVVMPSDHSAWLSMVELTKLFNVSQRTIERTLRSVNKDGNSTSDKNDTSSDTTSDNFSLIRFENGKKITRKIRHYSMEIVRQLSQKFGAKKYTNLRQFLNNYFDKSESNFSEIIIYDNGYVRIPLEVSKTQQTIWATQEQISSLFETTQPNVSMHIKNIFEDEELNESSVYKKSLYTGQDGKQYFVSFYNLDLVLAVGYRIRTSKAIAFRNWVSSVLKDFMIEGSAINEQRCLECKSSIINLSERVYHLEQHYGKEISYFKGDELRGFIEIKRFLETAKHEILIVDNYFGHEFDEILSKLTVEKTIITNPQNHKIESCENYTVIKTNFVHDRYLMVDDVWYHFGGSFKDVGESLSTGHLFTDQKLIEFIKSYKKKNNKEVK